ncbi:MAG: Uma2 family endonuclease [Cyanobacteria bacterium P01_H01_bin.152]
MVNTASRPKGIKTDTWVPATWENFVVLCERPDFEKARCYYDKGQMRIEMAPLGSLHGRENSVVSKVISLFAALNMIRVVEFLNTSLRKPGEREAQPDISFYLGQNFQLPGLNNQPVDVEVFGAPQLVVEIASTTLSDDLGPKRLLYERLGVQEYWVVNVAMSGVVAFAMENGGSREIRDSQVLSGLALSVLEEAMQRSQTEDDGALTRWLIQRFQG